MNHALNLRHFMTHISENRNWKRVLNFVTFFSRTNCVSVQYLWFPVILNMAEQVVVITTTSLMP